MTVLQCRIHLIDLLARLYHAHAETTNEKGTITGGALIAICAGYTVTGTRPPQKYEPGSIVGSGSACEWLGVEPVNRRLPASAWLNSSSGTAGRTGRSLAVEMPNVKASARPWSSPISKCPFPGSHLKTRGDRPDAGAPRWIEHRSAHKIFVRLTGGMELTQKMRTQIDTLIVRIEDAVPADENRNGVTGMVSR